MAYLIALYDMNVSATDAYKITDEKGLLKDKIKKALKEYLYYFEDEVDDLEKLIDDNLLFMFDKDKRLHEIDLELTEEYLESQGYDTNNPFPMMGGAVLDLEQDEEFKDFCQNIYWLEPEKLHFAINMDFTDYSEAKKVNKLFERMSCPE